MAQQEMQYTTLGRTGLRVSVAGLGCGGEAQLGLLRGKSEDDAVSLVKAALDEGVNFFDTSEAYKTQSAVGRAVKSVDRDSVVLCSKSRFRDMGTGELYPLERVLGNLEDSLRQLDVEKIDVYMVHGVVAEHYDHIRDVIIPVLQREKAKGKIGHIGMSEFPGVDPDHKGAVAALNDDFWEVMMIGFNMLHHGPITSIFPKTQEKGIGTAIMYAVRSIFSRPGAISEAFSEEIAAGTLSAEFGGADPLGWLVHEGGADGITDAAYRFARHTPGADVILFGTSSQKHLRDNIASLLKPALPEADVARLRRQFGHLRAVGLDLPDILREMIKNMK